MWKTDEYEDGRHTAPSASEAGKHPLPYLLEYPYPDGIKTAKTLSAEKYVCSLPRYVPKNPYIPKCYALSEGLFRTPLNSSKRVVQFMGSVADKWFLGFKCCVNTIQHPIQWHNQLIQLILVPIASQTYIQVIGADTLQFFQDMLQGSKNPVRINTPDKKIKIELMTTRVTESSKICSCISLP